MPLVRLRTGQILNNCYCGRCDARRRARVFQERFRWIYKYLPCGHLQVKGYTLPPEELERLGHVNYEHSVDPRAKSKISQAKADNEAQQAEIARVSSLQKLGFTRGRFYF